MSTKDLARTIIEGGRTRGSRWFRRHTHGVHRAAEHAVLHRLRLAKSSESDNERDTDSADGDAVFVKRRSAWKSFDDKLGPAKRWLDRQVGRPWDSVRGDLLARFDTRTTPGRHIVFDHMLPWVEEAGLHSRREFAIDAQGRLRRLPRNRARNRMVEHLPRPAHELAQWLDGRRVGERGGTLFWFLLTPTGAYRQHRRLDDEDGELWRSLPTSFRQAHAFDKPGLAPAPQSRQSRQSTPSTFGP